MDNNDNCSRAWVLPKHPLSRNEVKMLVSQAASSEFQALLLLQAECQYPLIEEDVDLLVRAVSKSQQFSKQLLEQQCNYYLNDKQIKLLEDSSASLPKLSRELIKLVPKGTFYPNWAISIFNSFDLLSQEQIELLLACTACDDYSIISVIKRYSRMLTTEQLNKLVESSDSLHVLKEVAPILSYSQRQLLLKQIVKSSDLTTAEGLLKTPFWNELDELDKSKLANLLIDSHLSAMLLETTIHLCRKFSVEQVDRLVEREISNIVDFSFFFSIKGLSDYAVTLVVEKMAGYPEQSYKYFYQMGDHLTPAQRQTILVELAKDPYWSHHALRGLKMTEQEKELFS